MPTRVLVTGIGAYPNLDRRTNELVSETRMLENKCANILVGAVDSFLSNVDGTSETI